MPAPEPIPGLRGPDKRLTRNHQGDFIRRVRLALDMTQDGFAKVMRVDRRQLIKWETGQALPNPRAHGDLQRLLESPLARAALQAHDVPPFDTDGGEESRP